MSTVFVSGPTGVLGRATIPRLLAAGYTVRALSRSPDRDSAIRALGAEPVRADLFDPSSLATALAGVEAVMHLATRIPPSTSMWRRGAWHENDRIRAIGTRNLARAAMQANVRTFVYASFAYVYPDNAERWIDAASTLVDPVSTVQSTIAAEEEVQRFAETPRCRGVSLRMGALYGPDLPSITEQLDLARRGISLVGASKSAYMPMLWIDDAGAALVAALQRAPSGVYDVVDDEPLPQGEIAAHMAKTVGRTRLFSPPAWLIPLLAGPAGSALVRSLRISNRRFREATGWRPMVRNAREGLALLAAAESAPPAIHVPISLRIGLGFMALFSLAVGAWQQLAPRSFYDDFPGFGRQWVAVDGPYNEHLMRDVGGAALAVGVLVLYAFFRPTIGLARAVAVAFLISQVPHFLYHLEHLEVLPADSDRLLQTANLLTALLVPLLVLLKSGEIGPRAATEITPRPLANRSGATDPTGRALMAR